MTLETTESKRRFLYRFKRRFLDRSIFDKNEKRTPFRRTLVDHLLRHPPRLVLISFALTIVVGTILLSFPQATTNNESLPLVPRFYIKLAEPVIGKALRVV